MPQSPSTTVAFVGCDRGLCNGIVGRGVGVFAARGIRCLLRLSLGTLGSVCGRCNASTSFTSSAASWRLTRASTRERGAPRRSVDNERINNRGQACSSGTGGCRRPTSRRAPIFSTMRFWLLASRRTTSTKTVPPVRRMTGRSWRPA